MTTNYKYNESVVEPLILRDEDTDYESDYPEYSDKRKIESAKATSKNVTFSPRTNVDEDDIALRMEKLEFNLTNVQVEESLSRDFHKNLRRRYEKVENTLDALSQYIDAVCLEMKACYRLCQHLNGLLGNERSLDPDETMLKLTKKICMETDLRFHYQVKEKICTALREKGNLNDLITDYNDRREDFKIASRNFKGLLDMRNLNIFQMDKLQEQYDKILANYQHTRCMLDKYIPDEISERIAVLLNCLCEFGEDLQRMASERTDMSQMFQHLHTNMKISDHDLVT